MAETEDAARDAFVAGWFAHARNPDQFVVEDAWHAYVADGPDSGCGCGHDHGTHDPRRPTCGHCHWCRRARERFVAGAVAEGLVLADALTPNHDGTPEYYTVSAEDVEYLVATVLGFAASTRAQLGGDDGA